MPVGAFGKHRLTTAAASSGVRTSAGYLRPLFGGVMPGAIIGAGTGPPESFLFGFRALAKPYRPPGGHGQDAGAEAKLFRRVSCPSGGPRREGTASERLDVLDAQDRLVAVAAERVEDLVDFVADLLRAHRVVFRLQHVKSRRGHTRQAHAPYLSI